MRGQKVIWTKKSSYGTDEGAGVRAATIASVSHYSLTILMKDGTYQPRARDYIDFWVSEEPIQLASV